MSVTMMTTGEWWRQAACQSAEPELFFPISATEASAAEIARAKQVCGRCEVREPCLAYALHDRQQQGIWGGMTEDERRLLRRRLPMANDRSAAETEGEHIKVAP
jgi:WhiB family redox-sensing transcriptional regulator